MPLILTTALKSSTVLATVMSCIYKGIFIKPETDKAVGVNQALINET